MIELERKIQQYKRLLFRLWLLLVAGNSAMFVFNVATGQTLYALINALVLSALLTYWVMRPPINP